MRRPRRVIVLIVLLLVGAIVVAGVVGAVLYANDYGVEASVRRVECTSSTPFIEVVTKLFGIVRETPITMGQCALIRAGNFVVYHIRTERTTVYDREGGKCLYDSQTITCSST